MQQNIFVFEQVKKILCKILQNMNFFEARYSNTVHGESISSAFFIFMSRIHKPSGIEITGYFFMYFQQVTKEDWTRQNPSQCDLQNP